MRFARTIPLIIAFTVTFIARAEIKIQLRMPRQEAMFKEGIKLYNDGKYDECLQLFAELSNDDEVFDNRHQLIMYAQMWLGNALARSGRLETAFRYSEPAILYSVCEPIDPDDMVEIDSLSHEAKSIYDYYMDETDVRKALDIYKKRQELLEQKLGSHHLWTNGGRFVLMDVYSRYAMECNRSSARHYDVGHTVAVSDTIAALGDEILECLDYNFANADNIYHKFVYYRELMSALDILSRTQFLEAYHDISFRLIDTISRLVAANPEIISYYTDHWLRWGHFHFFMRGIWESDEAPTPIYDIDRVKIAKTAEKAYLEFINGSPLAVEDWETKYEALDYLKSVYVFLELRDPIEEEGNSWDPDTFKYDFYNVEEAPDSIAMIHYQRVNDQGITNLLAGFLMSTIDNMVNDRTYEDLSYYEKKQADTFREIADLLHQNDFERYLNMCCMGSTTYKSLKLLRDDIALRRQALTEIDAHPDLRNASYFKLQIKAYLLGDYFSISEPVFSEIFSGAKSTFGKDEMLEFLKLYLKGYEEYVAEFKSHEGDLELLPEFRARSVREDFSTLQCQYANLLYQIAQKTDNEEFYGLALREMEEAVRNEYYDQAFHELEKKIQECRAHLGMSEGYDEINRTLIADFNELLTTFKYATAGQRSSIWEKFLRRLNNNLALCMLNTEDVSAGILAYNSLLFKKGILLASDKNFIDILNSSTLEDDDFKTKRDRFFSLLPSRALNGDSIATLERELLQYVRHVDYNANLLSDWSEIKNSLPKESAAVEFGVVSNIGKLRNVFAVVIDADKKTPLFVDLGKVDSVPYPCDQEFIQNVSETLNPHIRDSKTIYFSPDGFIYSMPIEHLIDDGRKWVRLSSTRRLKDEVLGNKGKNGKRQNQQKGITLFGGINYSAAPTAETAGQTDGNIKRELPRDMRAGAKNLPYTLKEINLIDSLATRHKIPTNLYSGKEGTEEALVALMGSEDLGVLHLATHGFYFTEEEYGQIFSGLTQPTKKSAIDDNHDDALSRCGLLLAGANRTLKRGYLTNDPADGILTGAEVENLNLENMTLLVLSACQTGLGEISGDGVFGLQRGFKKAGAGTILMSLWKVDDRATQLLMTKFYDEFLNGNNKNNALKSAQTFVRDYGGDGRYADPLYWAGFILLDAIN